MAYAIWLTCFLLISFGLGALYAPLRESTAFRIICAPGFLTVALLRIVGAAIAGYRIGKVHPFSGRDTVEIDAGDHEHILQKVVMGLFPFFGVFILVYLFTYLFSISGSVKWDAERMPGEFTGFIDAVWKIGSYFVDSFTRMLLRIPEWVLSALKSGDISALLCLYCIITLILAMPPRPRDFKYTLIGIVVFSLLIILAEGILTFDPGFEKRIWKVLSFTTALTIYIAFVSLAGVGGFRLFSSLHRDHKESQREKRNR